MPAGIRVLAAWNGGRAEVQIDANDRVIFIRTVGDGAQGVTCKRPDGSQSYHLPPGQAEMAVPTTVAGRIQLTWDAMRNRWDGLTGEAMNS